MGKYEQRAARNVFFTGFQIPLKLLMGLFLPPYILFKIGAETYGAWVLVMAVVAYISMFDIGLSNALAKFVAAYYATDNFKELNEMIGNVLVYCVIVGCVFLGLLYGFKDAIISLLFSKAPVDASVVKMLLFFISAIYILNMIGSVFNAVLVGIQRLDISILINIAGFVVNAITVVVLLIKGFGLLALAGGLGMNVLFLSVGAGICAYRLVPQFSLTGVRLNLAKNIRRLFRLGISDFMVRLSGVAVSQLNKFLLGYFAGLSWVAFYELAFVFVTQLSSLPAAIFAPFIPMASDLKARRDWESIKILYTKGLRYLNACGLPIFAFAIVFSYPIITVWLGQKYSAVAWAVQFIAIANFITLFNGPAYNISLGLGQPKIGIRFSLVLTGLTLLFSPILIAFFGYRGAVLSYTIVAPLATIFLFWNFHRHNSFLSGKLYFRNAVFPAIIIVPLAFCVKLFSGYSLYLDRRSIAISLVAAAIVYFALSVLVLWRMRIVGRKEWNLIWDAIRGVV